MAKVFIVNDSGHDFSAARKYGELVFLSTGSVDRYGLNRMLVEFSAQLAESTEDDFILPCGLTQMNMVATAILAAMHKKVNVLLHKYEDGQDAYVRRTLRLDDLYRFAPLHKTENSHGTRRTATSGGGRERLDSRRAGSERGHRRTGTEQGRAGRHRPDSSSGS